MLLFFLFLFQNSSLVFIASPIIFLSLFFLLFLALNILGLLFLLFPRHIEC